MNPKRLEHVAAGEEEATKLGATWTLLPRAGRHYIAVIGFNGQTRKTSLSVSPSDHRVCNKVRAVVRRAIREMSNGN